MTGVTVYGHPGEDATYSYDNTSQLTGADRDGTANDEDYTYDANGNRTNTGYSTGDNNRLLSDGTYNYTYDEEGNRLTKTNLATGEYELFEWDHRNRLASVTSYDAADVKEWEVEYEYDAFNRLVGRKFDSNGDGTFDQSGHFVYDGDQIVLVLDETGDVDHRLLWGPHVDQILADENSLGDVHWMLTDHLNTVRDIATYNASTDTTTIANHIAYDTFGNVLSETNAALDVAGFGYTARYFDEVTGLQYNSNRWYDAKTGRWISQDPIGFAAEDENLYRYVGNGPGQYTDPSGLERYDVGLPVPGGAPATYTVPPHQRDAFDRIMSQLRRSGSFGPLQAHEQAELRQRALLQLLEEEQISSPRDIPSVGPYVPSGSERHHLRICELATGDGNVRKLQQIEDLRRDGYGLTDDEWQYYQDYLRRRPFAERQAFYELHNYSLLGRMMDSLNPRWNGTGTVDDALMAMAPFAAVNPVTGNRVYPGLIRPGISSAPTQSVYHKGELLNGKVGSHRWFSTGINRSSVDALYRSGKIHRFEIPKDRLYEWESRGLVRRFRDLDQATGVINEEINFAPSLAGEINRYKCP